MHYGRVWRIRSLHLERWALLILCMPATLNDLLDLVAAVARNRRAQILDQVCVYEVRMCDSSVIARKHAKASACFRECRNRATWTLTDRRTDSGTHKKRTHENERKGREGREGE